MRKIKVLALTFFIAALFLNGCGLNEQVEIGAWKEQLKGNPAVEMPDMGLSLNDTEKKETDGSSQTDSEQLQFSILDYIKEMGNSMTDDLIEETVGDKFTVESNGLVKVKLLRVVDGDTLLVNYKDEVYIRLIGINTPESVHPDEEKNTDAGTDASNYTKELLADTEYVWLEFDTNLYDSYDRILAYVWLSNDKSDTDNMLNTKLLQSGTAEIMTLNPNTKYAEIFNDIAQ